MKQILIVCTGNTCRSAMADAILKSQLVQAHLQDTYSVESRGIAAFDGQPASDNAIIVCNEVGIDLTRHVARRITPEDIRNADRIYVMSNAHRDAIVELVPAAAERIRVLDIVDPYGLPVEDYRVCRDALINAFRKEFPDA